MHHNYLPHLLASLIFIPSGAWMLSLLISRIKRKLKVRQAFSTGVGVIAGYTASIDSSSQRERFPVITYGQNHEHRFVSESGRLFKKPFGSAVKILYNPLKPQQGYEANWWRFFMFETHLFLFGAFTMGVGLFLGIIALKHFFA